jgi:hypothetical protein
VAFPQSKKYFLFYNCTLRVLFPGRERQVDDSIEQHAVAGRDWLDTSAPANGGRAITGNCCLPTAVGGATPADGFHAQQRDGVDFNLVFIASSVNALH